MNDTNRTQTPPFQGVMIGKFWRKTRSRDGAEYYQSQRTGNGRYLLLPNPNAGQEGEGDFNLFVVPAENKRDQHL